MSPVPTEPCGGWTPTWLCALPTGSEAVSGIAIQAAVSVLDSFTAHRFGGCSTTIRPCKRSCFSASSGVWWQYASYPRPVWYDGVWSNLMCGGGCTDTCSCTELSEVLLPAPVSGIGQVKVDGVILTPNTDYRLDDWRKLVRLGGVWPECNDLNKEDTEVGTWSITFTVGMQLSPLGKMALGELAMEFIKLLMCDSGCKLPKPTQSLTRQGVSMNFIDPGEIFSAGHIGLYLCDLFVTTENPNALKTRSKVYDVDGANYRIVGV